MISPRSSGDLARTERARISLTMDQGQYHKHRQDVAYLCDGDQGELGPGKTITWSYQFDIDYYGDIVARLDALDRILSDPWPPAVRAQIEEIANARCLIFQVLSKLYRLIGRQR